MMKSCDVVRGRVSATTFQKGRPLVDRLRSKASASIRVAEALLCNVELQPPADSHVHYKAMYTIWEQPVLMPLSSS